MAEDAPSPRPTTEEPTAAETSENVNDAPKAVAAATDADRPVTDAVVAETVVETEKGAKMSDDTVDATADSNESDKAAEAPSEKSEKKEGDEDKENAADPDTGAMSGSVDTKKPHKKKSPAKSTPKSAPRKKSVGNLKNANTPSKVKNTAVNYEPGMQVLAKMRTFPPWPAVILSEELLPEALLKTRPSAKNPRAKGSSTEPTETRRHWPVIYMGTFEYSWISISNLDPLTPEQLASPPTNIKSKGLLDAYTVAQEGFDLEKVKELQTSEAMEIETTESDAAEEEPEEAESMEVDEPESEEKPKKKASSKKRKLSASDEEAETSEKPTKTPKKAATKAKTPKTSGKTPKTPKTPANGTTAKVAAKPKASTAKKEKIAAPPKSVKKKTPARNNKAKSAEKVNESDSERGEASSEITKEEDLVEIQLKQVKILRGRLQRGFLTKDTPPVASDMADMAQRFDNLEALQNQGIDAEVIKSTKINKVLKGITKLSSIPFDDKYNFKKRATDLLGKMNIILTSDAAAPVTEKTLAVGKEKDTKKAAEKKNGVKVDEITKGKEDGLAEGKVARKERSEEESTTNKKGDVEMKDIDGKVSEEKDLSKVAGGEKEIVEASA